MKQDTQTVLKNQKIDIENLTRKVNSIEEGVDHVGILLKDYKREVGIMDDFTEDDFDFNEFNVNTLDEYIHKDSGVQLKINDKEIMESLITGLVLSGYKVSARGNIIFIESGKEKIG